MIVAPVSTHETTCMSIYVQRQCACGNAHRAPPDAKPHLELQLALHREVLEAQGVLPVVGQALVEGIVLLLLRRQAM